MGRGHPHVPTDAGRRQAEALAAYGVPQDEIAGILGIAPMTLREHYRSELDLGSAKATSRVAESLYKKAIGDGHQSVTAAIFWLKTRGRWKEISSHELTGPDGGPILAELTVKFV